MVYAEGSIPFFTFFFLVGEGENNSHFIRFLYVISVIKTQISISSVVHVSKELTIISEVVLLRSIIHLVLNFISQFCAFSHQLNLLSDRNLFNPIRKDN